MTILWSAVYIKNNKIYKCSLIGHKTLFYNFFFYKFYTDLCFVSHHHRVSEEQWEKKNVLEWGPYRKWSRSNSQTTTPLTQTAQCKQHADVEFPHLPLGASVASLAFCPSFSLRERQHVNISCFELMNLLEQWDSVHTLKFNSIQFIYLYSTSNNGYCLKVALQK